MKINTITISQYVEIRDKVEGHVLTLTLLAAELRILAATVGNVAECFLIPKGIAEREWLEDCENIAESIARKVDIIYKNVANAMPEAFELENQEPEELKKSA